MPTGSGLVFGRAEPPHPPYGPREPTQGGWEADANPPPALSSDCPQDRGESDGGRRQRQAQTRRGVRMGLPIGEAIWGIITDAPRVDPVMDEAEDPACWRVGNESEDQEYARQCHTLGLRSLTALIPDLRLMTNERLARMQWSAVYVPYIWATMDEAGYGALVRALEEAMAGTEAALSLRAWWRRQGVHDKEAGLMRLRRMAEEDRRLGCPPPKSGPTFRRGYKRKSWSAAAHATRWHATLSMAQVRRTLA